MVERYDASACRLYAMWMLTVLFGLVAAGAQGAWVAHHGMTTSEYQAYFDQYRTNGYRVVRVSGYAQGTQPRYTAIWNQEPGPPWRASHGLSAAQYQSAVTNNAADGYRPVSVSGYAVGGTTLYAALWAQDGVGWRASHGLSAAEYQVAFDDNKAVGYRPICVSGYTVGGQERFAGIWEYGNPYPWAAAHGMTTAQYEAALNQYGTNDYRLAHLSGYEVGGQGRYAALWEKRDGPTRFNYHGMNSTDHQTQVNTFIACRYQMVDVSGYDVGGQATFGAIWERIPIAYLPASGVPVAAMQPFDDAMRKFMGDRGIRCGTLCVAKDGVVVYERGYGWKTADLSIPLRYDAPLRIASLCKPITAAAIRQLEAAGSLSFSDFVFNLPGLRPGILSLSPVGTPDPELWDITVQHLLDHEGGWDAHASGDPMFDALNIASVLGVPSPPDKEETARYMMGRPLDFSPGSTNAYSNFGYMLLGLVVEEIGGKPYPTYLHDELFTPMGVPSSEIEMGRTLPGWRNAREPWYSDPDSGQNVFNANQTVPTPDGAWHLEGMVAHGGLICTARAYTTFLNNYWISGVPRAGETWGFGFFGSLDGTFTLGRQRMDGVNISVFFNQREDCSGYGSDDVGVSKWTSELWAAMDGAAAAVGSWPTKDPANLTVNPALLQFKLGTGLQPSYLRWLPETGRVYQVQVSYDLQRWENYGPYQVGDGPMLEVDVQPLTARHPKAFFSIQTD